jgi:hypothetical protein
MAQSTDFQIGGSNTDGVFLSGQMQVGKNGHRSFWFNDSLNFVHTVQKNIPAYSDFHGTPLR